MAKRIAVIEKDKCNPLACGDYLCMRKCPLNRMGKEAIVKGPDGKAQINEDVCTGTCQICVNLCPFGAIHMVNLPEKLIQKPIHRYAKDSFILYNLPLPAMGKVIGILGRNGIGKSTALKILSGTIIANLGDPEKEDPQIDDLIEMYRGTEVQKFLKQVKQGKIKIAYKPQAVNLIPKEIEGTVEELLDQVNETGKKKEIIHELELKHLLDREISALSGGELQRLAMAATLLREANFYFFDEPASFLDITWRIKIAKIIKSLVSKDVAVMVVEHDLATLDYISDELQIVYGDAAVYGILSQVRPIRRGINEYLDGYLPDDNVRFRDYKIKFYKGLEQKTIRPTLFEWPDLEKSFKTFKIKINAGELQKGQVLTITGSNGLGKTTFLKMIAGLIKPTKGKIDSTLKIAYKPQDIRPEAGTVKEWLDKAAKDHDSGWFEKNILDKLNLKKIINSNISDLSGGELQKVFVAITLSLRADVYAFDEPSAFVDVEDRIKIAEVIRDFMNKQDTCAIVVDHDVQFVDYVGDSMLVFEGKPGIEGHVKGPLSKEEGMNEILKMLDITFRMDKESGRPRINQPNSQLDKKQKKEGNFYYTK